MADSRNGMMAVRNNWCNVCVGDMSAALLMTMTLVDIGDDRSPTIPPETNAPATIALQ
nr:hypothetical protein [Alicyclobacillus contaminans]